MKSTFLSFFAAVLFLTSAPAHAYFWPPMTSVPQVVYTVDDGWPDWIGREKYNTSPWTLLKKPVMKVNKAPQLTEQDPDGWPKWIGRPIWR